MSYTLVPSELSDLLELEYLPTIVAGDPEGNAHTERDPTWVKVNSQYPALSSIWAQRVYRFSVCNTGLWQRPDLALLLVTALKYSSQFFIRGGRIWENTPDASNTRTLVVEGPLQEILNAENSYGFAIRHLMKATPVAELSPSVKVTRPLLARFRSESNEQVPVYLLSPVPVDGPSLSDWAGTQGMLPTWYTPGVAPNRGFSLATPSLVASGVEFLEGLHHHVMRKGRQSSPYRLYECSAQSNEQVLDLRGFNSAELSTILSELPQELLTPILIEVRHPEDTLSVVHVNSVYRKANLIVGCPVDRFPAALEVLSAATSEASAFGDNPLAGVAIEFLSGAKAFVPKACTLAVGESRYSMTSLCTCPRAVSSLSFIPLAGLCPQVAPLLAECQYHTFGY